MGSPNKFLTAECGFKVTYVASLIWGAWSLQHGIRALIATNGRTEEDIVALFGPHFKEPSLAANTVANFLSGTSSVNQSYAATYLVMENCVMACDVLLGSLMLVTTIPFALLFGSHYRSEKGSPESTLKGGLKVWLAMMILLWISYVGGLLGDAGNVFHALPTDAHVAAITMLVLRYLMGLFPLSNCIFGFLWYRKMHVEGDVEEGCLARWLFYCSITEWGWHIFWLVAFILNWTVFIVMLSIDVRPASTRSLQ